MERDIDTGTLSSGSNRSAAFLYAFLVLSSFIAKKNIIYIFEKINDYANEPTKEDLLDYLVDTIYGNRCELIALIGLHNFFSLRKENLCVGYWVC